MAMCPGPHSMTLLEQPNFSTSFTGFLVELKDRHQICYNLCKTAVLECNLGCLVKPPGKTIKGYKPRARCFSRTFILWPKLVEAPSVLTTKNMIFVCCLLPPSSQLNIFLTCDIAIWLWLWGICTPYNAERSHLLPRVLYYLAHSGEQHYKLNGKHKKCYLQCKAQGFFIEQIPLMKSTLLSPLACSSKINAKAFIYNYMSFWKD